MTGVPSSLLMAALHGSDTEAGASWNAWRTSVDIQHLSWPEMQFIPLLNGPRLQEWLAGDPASGVLKGIVRRAWSEAEVRLALAQEAVAALQQAGCTSVTLFGPVSLYLRSRHLQSIRPISEIRLLIPRHDPVNAAAALRALGWLLYGEPPTGLDATTHMSFSRDGIGLYLHWRVLSVPADQAASCELEFLSSCEIIEALGTSLRVLAPGHGLLDAVMPRTDSGSVDVIPWQADAAQMPRHAIDWTAWTTLAMKFYPQALDRVSELRALGIDMPLLQRPEVPAAPVVDVLHGRLRPSLRAFLRRNARRARRLLSPKERE
jgi:hypothetical protein